jgi:acryloyl-coenzyme A reductase
MRDSMKATLLTAFGGPETLKYADVPMPSAGPNDILLEVCACGVDRKDLLIRNGTIRRKSVGYRSAAGDVRRDIALPLILGIEFSGTVVEVGRDVRSFRPGDRVASLPRRGHCGRCAYCLNGRSESCAETYMFGQDVPGGYAEFVLVGADSLCKVPASVSLGDASLAATCVGTMVRAIRDIGQIKIGESVLVTGGSGGLGIHGIQLAKLAGGVVIGLTSSQSKAQFLRDSGANEVVVAAHGEDWSDRVLELTKGRGVDVCIDTVGSATLKGVMRCMALYGRVVMVGDIDSGSVDLKPAIVFLRRLQLLGSYAPGMNHLATALELMESGRLQTVIDSRFPLSEAPQAHARVESGVAIGRVVLVVSASGQM